MKKSDEPAFPALFAASCDLEGLHQDLARWNHARLGPASPTDTWEEDLKTEHFMRWREGQWVEAFRAMVAEEAAQAPADPEAFIAWFEGLKETGPGQYDPLFDWLARDADPHGMRWFLTQEAAGEAGFDDLVALTQVKLPKRAKLELAANYWDEMGRGHIEGMHGPMLERTVETLGLTPAIERTIWQSLALANTLTAFATTRRYAWHSVGALGVVELTAPSRVSLVGQGLKRLGFAPIARKYFDLHAALDIKHAQDWIANALRPLLEDNPECRVSLAEGALMRLYAGAACFEAYRGHLWRRPVMRFAAE